MKKFIFGFVLSLVIVGLPAAIILHSQKAPDPQPEAEIETFDEPHGM